LKGAIIYYSNTGNTKLACEYIQKKSGNIRFDLIDMVREKNADLSDYELLGFAFFADTWQPPKLFVRYVESLRGASGKFAFCFHTYGAISGKAARIMVDILKKKGLKLIGEHALHTPENYPPMIAAGQGNKNKPREKDMRAFDAIIRALDEKAAMNEKGLEPEEEHAHIGLFNSLLPKNPGMLNTMLAGKFRLDVEQVKCIRCGTCERICPVNAISIDEEVSIDHARCEKCWSCYNHCPVGAIINGRYRGNARYPGPSKTYTDKFSV
jgi:ferredoxin/flavodoxin